MSFANATAVPTRDIATYEVNGMVVKGSVAVCSLCSTVLGEPSTLLVGLLFRDTLSGKWTVKASGSVFHGTNLEPEALIAKITSELDENLNEVCWLPELLALNR